MCTLEILLHQDSVDEVPVMLVYEGSGRGHFLLLLILQGKGQLWSNRVVLPQNKQLTTCVLDNVPTSTF